MAKPTLSFAISKGDPVRLATAFQHLVVALEPLTDEEAQEVTRELAKMYARPKAKGARRG